MLEYFEGCFLLKLFFGSTPHDVVDSPSGASLCEDPGRRGTASRCREDLPGDLHPRMVRSAMHRTLIGGSDGPWVDVCIDQYEI